MLPFIRSDLTQFAAYTPHPEASGETLPPAQWDRLDTNECPFDLPEDLKQKLAWTYQQEIEANRYPDGSHLALKQAIATYANEALADRSGFTAQHISVGNGSDELIRSLLIATCLGNGAAVFVADPTFSMYAILAQTLGIPVVRGDRTESDFAMNLETATAALCSSHSAPVRVVFVVHPNSPTGNRLTAAELDWLRQLSPEILVVVDEAYFEFSQTTLAPEVLQRPNWVILRTFSKAFRLAAHRVGYAIADPDLAAILEKVRLPYNLPAYTQAAAQVALAQRQLLLQAIPELLAERDRLQQALAAFPTLRLWPSAANFIYLRAQTEAATAQLAQTLKAQGTLIRHTGGGLRITVGTAAENRRTLERLQQILASRL